MRVIVASTNENKLREIRQLMRAYPFAVLGLRDIAYTEDIVEDGASFAENARLKVDALAKLYPHDCIIADDSGLCVDCLDGRPGIHSARYMGAESTYAEKIAALQAEAEAAAPGPHTARFICAIGCHMPDGTIFSVQGEMKGEIAKEPRGQHGFGYDPIFLLPDLGLTAAELTEEEKNRLSHRGQALRLLLNEWQKRIEIM